MLCEVVCVEGGGEGGSRREKGKCDGGEGELMTSGLIETMYVCLSVLSCMCVCMFYNINTT